MRVYPALSLSVALANPALRLYERLGFVAVSVTEAHQTMRLEL
jgi:ribosomal protein S18 acetylase RimI-like enzyme